MAEKKLAKLYFLHNPEGNRPQNTSVSEPLRSWALSFPTRSNTITRFCEWMFLDSGVTPTATSYHPLTKADRCCRKFGNSFHHNFLCTECLIRNYTVYCQISSWYGHWFAMNSAKFAPLNVWNFAPLHVSALCYANFDPLNILSSI